MADKPESPPAFPVPENTILKMEGLTMRDYFAANVIQGIYAAETNRANLDKAHEWVDYSYDVADAMLKRRQSV